MGNRRRRRVLIRQAGRWRTRPPPKCRSDGAVGLILASAAVFAATVAVGLAWPRLTNVIALTSRPAELAQVSYVIDGDTLVIAGGERVRLLGIDAPEMPPRASCDREVEMALAAKARLMALLRQAEVVELRRQGEDRDRYGRQLRRVFADGQDLGDALVLEGLAQRWRGRKATWC